MKIYNSFSELAAANSSPQYTPNTFSGAVTNGTIMGDAKEIQRLIKDLEFIDADILEPLYKEGGEGERKYGGRASIAMEDVIFNLKELLRSDQAYQIALANCKNDTQRNLIHSIKNNDAPVVEIEIEIPLTTEEDATGGANQECHVEDGKIMPLEDPAWQEKHLSEPDEDGWCQIINENTDNGIWDTIRTGASAIGGAVKAGAGMVGSAAGQIAEGAKAGIEASKQRQAQEKHAQVAQMAETAPQQIAQSTKQQIVKVIDSIKQVGDQDMLGRFRSQAGNALKKELGIR
jgi:hypothetical protein